MATKPIALSLALLAAAATISITCAAPSHGATLQEDFDGFPATGWTTSNNSDAPDKSWSIGNADAQRSFPAFSSGTNSGASAYAAASYMSTSLDVGTISNWLITPNLTFNNGDTLSFYTRTVGSADVFAPDRLQVRFAAGSADTTSTVAGGSDSVGAFTQLLLDINPTYTIGSYPSDWQQFSYTFTSLNAPTSGAVGFRYFVESGGAFGLNSDYIGLDSVSIESVVTPVPEPSVLALMCAGLGFIASIVHRRRIST